MRCISTGRRDFYQRLNEQQLAHELKNLAVVAQGGEAEETLFDPKIKFNPLRRRRPVTHFDDDEGAAPPDEGRERDLQAGGKTKPWLHYESLRGRTYPDRLGGPRWRDLTHEEAQRMKEMYMRKQMLERKILWMKSQHLPNPQRDAKLQLRAEREREKMKEERAMELYPPPLIDTPLEDEEKKLKKLQDLGQQLELESRFRNRIREQKLENARIVKANQPAVGGIITDPIQRHVQRRLLRQRPGIHQGLEEVLSHNTAQILYEFLDGAAISIVRVRAKRPRQTQEILYNVTSDHDPEWVQQRLDVLAPKLRSLLALRVNMGQTPNIRFVRHLPLPEMRKRHLWPHAAAIDTAVPVGASFSDHVPAVASRKR